MDSLNIKELKSEFYFTDDQRFLLIAIVPIYFMIVGLLCSPIDSIIPGIINIVREPDFLITDYIVVGGIGAAFFNAGILTLFLIWLLHAFKVPFDRHTIVGTYLMFGFSLFGKNIVNIWFILIGFYIYAVLHRYSLKKYIYIGLYGTCLSPAITLVMHIGGLQWWWQLLLAASTGLIIGYVLLPISLHVKVAHKGYSLYNVGFSAGIIATVLVSLFLSFGIEIESRLIWATEYNELFAYVLNILFIAMIVFAFIIRGKKLIPEYIKLLKESGVGSEYEHNYSDACSILNMGMNGLFSTWFLILTGCDLNGPTIGSIFTIVGFSPAGKHLRNIAWVMIGVLISDIVTIRDITIPAATLTLLLSTTLAPIAGQFGIVAGIIAGFVHSAVALNVGIVYKGLNLYNNGFAGGMVAIFLVPVIEAIVEKTKDAKENGMKKKTKLKEQHTDN